VNTEQQAAQLELAAQILRTGHPWECSQPKWQNASLTFLLHERIEIRPILATPPDGRKLHNPDNLTAEQVGVGYRLTLEEEMDGHENDGGELYDPNENQFIKGDGKWFWFKCDTIRVPLSTPWPEAKTDPYAELKKAQEEGKVIQVQMHNTWQDTEDPNLRWSLPPECYRIKPWTMPEPPAGKQWHRPEALTQTDWETGWRPLLTSEIINDCDEYSTLGGKLWVPAFYASIGSPIKELYNAYRTKRPLPVEKEPVWVPLGPEDVQPGTVFRHHNWDKMLWIQPNSVVGEGVIWCQLYSDDTMLNDFVIWQSLMDDGWRILRPGQTEWQPCRKESK